MDCNSAVVPYALIRTTIIATLLPLCILLNYGYALSVILFLLMVYLVTYDRPYWIYVLANTLPRDIRFMFIVMKVFYVLKKWAKQNVTVPKRFIELVHRHPDKVLYFSEEGRWTYQDLYDYTNKVSRVLKECGIRRGDNIGIIFDNKNGAQQSGFWLASSFIGVPIALIPPQLKSFALVHSINAANVNYLIYTQHSIEAIEEIQSDPNMKNVKLLQYNINGEAPILPSAVCLATKLRDVPSTPFIQEVNSFSCYDTFMYMYTSGTTGLPKATIITHVRYLMMATILNKLACLNERDVFYATLPLHHAAGANLAVGQGLIYGVPLVLRNKFSASNFWKDCVKYKCTIAQYIGEICRFLLNSAKKSGEKDPAGPHCIRLMCGNGLRESLWDDFQKTFKIPKIIEYYGATEGNTNMVNISSQKAAVGFTPRFLKSISPLKIIKCDTVTGEPFRDKNGFGVLCKPCEAGLLVAKTDVERDVFSFTGYVDSEATKKKILHNVLKAGDSFFNSGDIMVMDDFGYIYFRDRTGDTFRWRGENVSANEVENAITSISKLDTIVYGVEIPNIEGKTGMAAIVDVDNKLDLKSLGKALKKILPSHTHPLFIRIVTEIEFTSTFKMVKKNFQMDGFDLNKMKDQLYFLDPMSYSYVPLTKLLYDEIINGKIRL